MSAPPGCIRFYFQRILGSAILELLMHSKKLSVQTGYAFKKGWSAKHVTHSKQAQCPNRCRIDHIQTPY